MSKPLSERIATALRGQPSAADLATLIGEAGEAVANAAIDKPNIDRAEKIARGVHAGDWKATIVGSLRLPKAIDDGWLAYPKGQSR